MEANAGHLSKGWNFSARLCCGALAGAALLAAGGAGAATNGAAALREMSLAELMDIEVSSVSRTESTVAESPAAIFVCAGRAG